MNAFKQKLLEQTQSTTQERDLFLIHIKNKPCDVPVGGESDSFSVLLLLSNLGPPPSSSVAMVLWMFWYLQKQRVIFA